MEQLLVIEYYASALYALALGTPRGVLQYAELSFAEEDNFEGAQGFKMALEDTEGKSFNCRVVLPEGFEIQPIFTDEDEEDFYNDYEDE